MTTREALLDTLTALASRRSDEELAALVRSVSGLDEPDAIDPGRWGPDPAPESRFRTLAALRAQRERALDGALTREQAARLLGVSAQRVSNLLDAGGVVAIKEGGRWRLPRWQFSADGPLPGLDEIAAAFPGGAVALTLWAGSAIAELQGRTPAQALAEGDIGPVLEQVHALRAAGW